MVNFCRLEDSLIGYLAEMTSNDHANYSWSNDWERFISATTCGWNKPFFWNYLKNGNSKSLANSSAILPPNQIAVAIIPELKIACSITAMAYLPFFINQAKRLIWFSAANGKTLVKKQVKLVIFQQSNICLRIQWLKVLSQFKIGAGFPRITARGGFIN